MSELPDWPEKPSPAMKYRGGYQRMRYEAAMARLRELHEVVRVTLKMHDDCLCRDRRKAFADVMDTIGELPK